MERNRENDIVLTVFALAYNHEKYIRETLEGIVRQKTNFKFEVLLHDDASTDNTSEIIKEYEKKYPEIIRPIYQTENQYSQGKEIVFDIMRPLAKGRYYAFCECDDYWCDECKLQKQVDFLEQHPDYWLCGHNSRVIVMGGGSEYLFSQSNESCEIRLKKSKYQWEPYCQTASIVCRRQCQDTWPSWLVRAEVAGDYKRMLWALTQGRAFYMDFVGSVYRSGTEGSYSEKFNNNIEFAIKGYIAEIEFDRKFDKFTEKKYRLIFNYWIKRKLERVFAKTNQIKRIEKEIGYYYVFRHHGCKSTICLFLYVHFPKLYYKLKSVKNYFN